MTDEQDKKEKPEDTRSPTLKVQDGGQPRGDEAQGWIKKLFDIEGDNFLGSGMNFHEWSRLGDVIRYHRWYGTQARDEKKRRMKYVVAMSVEHDRICQQDRFATFWSEACIEAVIAGDWNEVKMWAGSLKFEEESPDLRNIAAPKFAKFVEIALEAWETRPKVFCPVCRKPTPEDYIGKHHDGRHVCPWCDVVHDDAGEWVEKDKAHMSSVDEQPEAEQEPVPEAEEAEDD
jgi:hypothetical protein